mmetsp:Transcript_99290/g.250725  ORF Transcript_99290/g.250725 Transcript_99290/m.250725 type:complete len:200 (-) Transcript_99290:534-1133(-)
MATSGAAACAVDSAAIVPGTSRAVPREVPTDAVSSVVGWALSNPACPRPTSAVADCSPTPSVGRSASARSLPGKPCSTMAGRGEEAVLALGMCCSNRAVKFCLAARPTLRSCISPISNPPHGGNPTAGGLPRQGDAMALLATLLSYRCLGLVPCAGAMPASGCRSALAEGFGSLVSARAWISDWLRAATFLFASGFATA